MEENIFEVHINVPNSRDNRRSMRMSMRRNAFIIEGGGTKGIYAIGILKYLFDNNPYLHMKSINIFGGTSVGSFLAAALSLGFDQNDMVEFSKMIDIGKLVDAKLKVMVSLCRLLSKGYLYRDCGRRDIVNKVLNYRISTINEHLDLHDHHQISGKDLTFGHLRLLINKHPNIYKHLLINAVDINRHHQVFMTTLEDTWDEIKLIDALLASSAIPFVFKPVKLYHNPTTDRYTYQMTDETTLNSLIDGGVSTNNPLDYFLVNNDQYSDHIIWLLKFTSQPQFVKIETNRALLKQVADYLISGKNDIKMDLLQERYNIHIINLHSTAGTLEIYSTKKIQKIIQDIYEQCVSGNIYFGN